MEANDDEIIQLEETEWIERSEHDLILRKNRLNTQRLIKEFQAKIQRQNQQIELLMKEVRRQKVLIDTFTNEDNECVENTPDTHSNGINATGLTDNVVIHPKIQIRPAAIKSTNGLKTHLLKPIAKEIRRVKPIQCRRPEVERKKPSLLSIHIQPNFQHLTNIYACDECNKAMSSRRVLAKHKRMVHCLQKEFVCDHCSKAFCVRDGLKRHLRIHTGEKPFVCRGCQKGFNQSGNMRIHEKTCKKYLKQRVHSNE